MDDAVALATMDALTMLFSPALHTDANLACLTICKAINLSLEFGNSDASCVAYTNLSLVTGQRFGDYQAGFRFGQLGCELVERRGLARYGARTYLSFSLFVARWAKPVRYCRELLDRAFDAANRIGDYSYGAFASNIIVSNLLFAGERLPDLQQEAERGLAYTRKVRFGLVTDFRYSVALIQSSSMKSRQKPTSSRPLRSLPVATGSENCKRATWLASLTLPWKPPHGRSRYSRCRIRFWKRPNTTCTARSRWGDGASVFLAPVNNSWIPWLSTSENCELGQLSVRRTSLAIPRCWGRKLPA
jgi:hypothetical protein